ncbi:magnesium-translocating P-type ATPase [Mahella sp.]|jgi:Mg2+-importing ATPase|uniref:magnesium-translocating P-type ATPase n=1 Tax=Mahella sp. TaxID=2798721 RepID=UPI0024AA8389|nr:magnesium-translocating P-type ATPase [Mahella sp.]MBZ4666482.1 mgtA [Mahella sp.]MDI3508343.1 P-type Mg2+ transporter [Clostridiales bacterium]MDK2902625.1 P-type Mg2+ transporter [Clostridiales bacterium]
MKRKIIQTVSSAVSPVAEKLIRASRMETDELLKEYNTTLNGYNEETAAELRDKYGKNEISREKPESVYKRLIDAFINPFTVVLFVLTAISFFTDVVIVAPGEKDPSTVIIICTMVIISALLRFIQETRSNNSAEKLKTMVTTTVTVTRGEEGRKEVPSADIVPGDIIFLTAGDMVPADVRIISCKDLFVSQSSLTGESEPVEKFSYAIAQETKNPLDLPNLAFMGSNVVSGSAVCIVLATGDFTCFGSMAKAISDNQVTTSFEKGINSVSWVLIRFMMCMVPVVFFINGFTKGDWFQAFLFALSVAVGLTPEMLPMIVTTNLAKGAVAMANKKTIVKHLNSIQNFGAMDVLCTDKTGTITQDHIVLERYLDIHGNEDERILRHAFLNSYYQTGLKNLMDVAIINHAKTEPYRSLREKYTKVDEIPFDFNRRRMSVVIRDQDGKTQLITKGAVEEMLSICTYTEYNGTVVELSDDIRKEIISTVAELSNQGMRVLAVAQKNNPPVEGVFSVKDESDMVLIGYLAFLDPPKDTAAAAIMALNDYGVAVKVLTGDSDAVAKCICRQVGLKVDNMLLGSEIEEMNDEKLAVVVEKTNLFAKLTPQQKARIVRTLRSNGHIVGFMGDGINDAAAMHEADVAISVDTAVDVAKDSADIILLEKDLTVLEQGVIEGRRTFGNIIKYIKMTTSSNFGNMFSVVTASAFLPFLPMQPIQILFLNLIYDISCIAIPWDNMDEDYLKIPRKWDASSIGSFMIWLGPTSSVFDITTYIIMFFVICPVITGGAYGSKGINSASFISLFNSGWFVESLWSQTLVIHMIRTPRIPFIQSRASIPVLLSTSAAIAVGTVTPYTPFGRVLGMAAMPAIYFSWLLAMILCYMLLATFMKTMYRRRYGELL